MTVNPALSHKRPLLIKDEPATGKTLLALMIARSPGLPRIERPIQSTTKAQHGRYEHDAVSRLPDSRFSASLTPRGAACRATAGGPRDARRRLFDACL